MKKILVIKVGFAFLLIFILVISFFAFKNNSTITPDSSLAERCKQKNLPYMNSSLPVKERVIDLMSRMSEAEKIGQMVLVEKNSIDDLDDITQYNLGALLSGGGAGPKQDTPQAWLQMVNDFYDAAKKTCLGIPLIYGIDANHGNGNILGSVIFPHSIGLGATRDADLVRRVARATADEIAATGIYWSFSPNLDVAKDYRWGKTYETFGSDTALVSELGSAYLKGTQDSSNGYIHVVATAKHFIGGGAMEYGTSNNEDFTIEEGNIILNEEALRQIHLPPFQKAVADGVRSVMVGTARWNGVINPSNHYLLTNVLKEELGFSGFIVSDWYAVYLITPSKYESLVTAINAGVDMVMTPFKYKDFIFNIRKALLNGDITKERIDDAVSRILTVKFEAGLFDRPRAQLAGLSVINSDLHRQIAREAVYKSQVLLKNENSVLPLSTSLKKILVAGSAADNLGRQAGGWTTEWQGIDGNSGIVGTTILAAIKNIVSSDTQITYNEQGDFSYEDRGADVGIVVVGEKPYAEGWGDNAHPKLSSDDLLAIEKIRLKSKKIVVIIISGRPLDIFPESKKWDSIVASWLPGSEGGGVIDVLFGIRPFTGKLPIKWDY